MKKLFLVALFSASLSHAMEENGARPSGPVLVGGAAPQEVAQINDDVSPARLEEGNVPPAGARRRTSHNKHAALLKIAQSFDAQVAASKELGKHMADAYGRIWSAQTCQSSSSCAAITVVGYFIAYYLSNIWWELNMMRHSAIN